MVDFHPAVNLEPALIGPVADTDLLAGLTDGFPWTSKTSAPRSL
jgi:hypothetical protein